MYDYFYGAESEQFSFYRIPKVLFTEERFKAISAEAKVLYGLLLDRMSLSAKNGWQDKENRVYIIFTIEDIMEAMGCADRKPESSCMSWKVNADSSSENGRASASPISSMLRTSLPPRNHISRNVKIMILEV